jgi:hypothetical protein
MLHDFRNGRSAARFARRFRKFAPESRKLASFFDSDRLLKQFQGGPQGRRQPMAGRAILKVRKHGVVVRAACGERSSGKNIEDVVAIHDRILVTRRPAGY